MMNEKCQVEVGEEHEQGVTEEITEREHLPVCFKAAGFTGVEPSRSEGGVVVGDKVGVESVCTSDGGNKGVKKGDDTSSEFWISCLFIVISTMRQQQRRSRFNKFFILGSDLTLEMEVKISDEDCSCESNSERFVETEGI